MLFLIIPECDRGSYGIGCNETCGHCHDKNQSSNINGTCLNGCDAGFLEQLCNTRKMIFNAVFSNIDRILFYCWLL